WRGSTRGCEARLFPLLRVRLWGELHRARGLLRAQIGHYVLEPVPLEDVMAYLRAQEAAGAVKLTPQPDAKKGK
ncbi:MAG: hypothetical protein ACHQQ3_11510, partial [Gemmatimonadales bacterium]